MPDTLAAASAAADTAVTAAEQEAHDAEELLGALEERVRDGDDTVTAGEVANARELGRFARLRAEAAQRKADKAKRQARLDAIGALIDEIRAADTNRDDLAGALEAFDAALRSLIGLAAAHDRQVQTWRQRGIALGIQPGASEAGLTVPLFGGGVAVDGHAVEEVPIGSFISAVVYRATNDDRRIAHLGMALAVRCEDWRDGYHPMDLAAALPAAKLPDRS